MLQVHIRSNTSCRLAVDPFASLVKSVAGSWLTCVFISSNNRKLALGYHSSSACFKYLFNVRTALQYTKIFGACLTCIEQKYLTEMKLNPT